MEFAGKALQIDVVIAGAQKCATTSLAAALAAHPGICLADGKEAHLFDRRDIQEAGPSQDDLSSFFAHRTPHQLLLDATPSYMYLPGCIEALVQHNPDVRVIVVLRNPAERAISQYFHQRRVGPEPYPLSLALLMEKRRLRRDQNPLSVDSAHRNYSYVSRGRYEWQIEKILALTNNLMVIDFVDLITSPSEVINAIFQYLDLPQILTPSLPTLNAGTGKAWLPGRWVARHMIRTFRYPSPSITAGESRSNKKCL
jgi:hypothetical protein